MLSSNDAWDVFWQTSFLSFHSLRDHMVQPGITSFCCDFFFFNIWCRSLPLRVSTLPFAFSNWETSSTTYTFFALRTSCDFLGILVLFEMNTKAILGVLWHPWFQRWSFPDRVDCDWSDLDIRGSRGYPLKYRYSRSSYFIFSSGPFWHFEFLLGWIDILNRHFVRSLTLLGQSNPLTSSLAHLFCNYYN